MTHYSPLRIAVRQAVLLLGLGLATLPHANAAGSFTSSAYDLSIPAGSMDAAITELSRVTGLNIVFDTADLAAQRSHGVRGHYSVEQALKLILAGTGLQAQPLSQGGYQLVPAPDNDAKAGITLAPTEVVGLASLGEMTENSGAYATGLAQVGGKSEQTLREIPQSVTVMTQQRLKDQQLHTLRDTLDQTTGITLTGGNDANTTIFSRGFALTNVQTDGGAAGLRQQSYDSLPDMLPYDHVEVLRGSDGLYGGTGDPAGTINLVRKRALDHNQVVLQTSAGSWDNYRQEVDVTGPMGFDGKLRGRVAMAYEDKKGFYDNYDSEKHIVFGTLEADVTPDTLVTVGGTYEWRDIDGYWDEGLPRYVTGEPLDLSRHTSTSAAWSTGNFKRTEGFIKLQHQINDNWKFNTSYTKSKFESHADLGQLEGPIDPTVTNGGTFQQFVRDYSNNQDLVDVNFDGHFDAFGRTHEWIVGSDYTQSRRTYADHSDFAAAPAVDPYSDITSMPKGATPPLYYDTPSWVARKTGVYTTLKAQLTDPLKLIIGARYTDYNGFNQVLVPSVNANTTRGGKESGIITPYGGLVYDLGNDWSLYTSYAQIYKPQTEFIDSSFAPLKAITGSTYEFGTKGELLDGRLNVFSALYYIKRENEAILDFSGSGPGGNQNNCCYSPSGEIVSKGIDTEVSGELLPGWMMSAGYTFNINRQTSAASAASQNKPISTQTPKHLFKFFTTYQLQGPFERFKVGLGATVQSANYVSGSVQRRLADGSLSNAVDDYNYIQAGYAVWNSLVEYRIDQHWTAAVNANNIFDKKYYQTVESSSYGNWYGAPRNFALTLRGSF
ncbi:TonB-dependent siderophore receptor [Pseudomonas sp. KNUC1026]|uniref:TonB-dependent siderophore receptor n=1 Tax=Pseudomonas sp. KNUC1026 TaxID=2893890 RepID=UPI001F2B6007|nr:TonB-dependent receptor [Pseudomonas sp. KNUC1026]UFH51110.1 TonB-dependent receptor [Pseudomonas sp. KNUC1026]